MESRALIRDMIEGDCEIIAQAFRAQGWNKPVPQYRTYWQEHQASQRTVLVAEQDRQFAGYVTIVWQSDYPPFREQGIPEIVDFNVLIKYRYRGIGSALMDEAEKRIGFRSAIVGLGVGVTADYGAAQVLYVKHGYVPDGRGLFQHGQHLHHGETIVIDDHLAWYFTKRVR